LSLEEVRKDLLHQINQKSKIMALSKPMKPNYSVSVPKGWVEGGSVGPTDFHCWVENDAGTVVYDPSFAAYNMICDMRGLDINKPVYKAWPNQQKWVKKRCKHQQLWLALLHGKDPKKALKIMKNTKVTEGRGALAGMTNTTISDFYNNPQELMCTFNAWAWFLNQTLVKHRSDLHIRIGSMGWRNMDDNTNVFYEFG
jgi:hypothetical protein